MESTLPRNYEDHTAVRRLNSQTLYKLVHKIIPMSRAMKIPDANAAVEKE